LLGRIIRSLPTSVLFPVYWIKNNLFPTNSIPILYYHQVHPSAPESVSPDFFEQQIYFLKKQGFNFISLREFFDEHVRENFWGGKNIVITFDDGYEDNYLYAFPIIKKFGLKCTIFISTYFIENKCLFPWHNSKLGADKDFKMLSWEQIEEMSKYGIEFGSHTVSHPDLTILNDSDIRKELEESRVTIENHTNQSVDFLCYPFGRYNQRVIRVASELGYQGACTEIYGRNNKDTPAYELQRLNVSSTIQGSFDLRKRLIGAYNIPMTIRQFIKNKTVIISEEV